MFTPFPIETSGNLYQGFPGSSVDKESTCNAGDPGSPPGLGRSAGEGTGYPLQYSALENSMEYSPWGCKELDMTEQLSLHFRNVQACPLFFLSSLVPGKGKKKTSFLFFYFSLQQASSEFNPWSLEGSREASVSIIRYLSRIPAGRALAFILDSCNVLQPDSQRKKIERFR